MVFLEVGLACASSQIWVTSDDWQLQWIQWNPTNTLLTSFGVGHGWFFLSWTPITCPITLSPITTTSVLYNPMLGNITAHLSLTTNGTYMGLIHVKTPDAVTAIRIQFGSVVQKVIAQADSIPVTKVASYFAFYPSVDVSYSKFIIVYLIRWVFGQPLNQTQQKSSSFP
jgi:hypothetical protein